jgi:hypothetical protein
VEAVAQHVHPHERAFGAKVAHLHEDFSHSVQAARDKLREHGIVANAFCPTGDKGGVNPHCSPPKGEGTREDPVRCKDNLDLAVRMLAEGKHVRLKQKRQVSTLIDKLAAMVKECEAKGEQAPHIDLCLVSVKNTNLFCVDEETEIMTRNGWKRYNEIAVGDTVLTLDHTTGFSEWQPLQAVNVFPHERRDVLLMDGCTHSSLTTLDHRWPIIAGRVGRYAVKRTWTTSSNLKHGQKIQRAAPCDNLPDASQFPDALVEVVAWVWTEGHIDSGSTVRIYQSHVEHPHHCRAIRKALTSLYGPAYEGDMRSLRTALKRSRSGEVKPPTSAWKETKNEDNGVTSFFLNAAASKMVLEVMDDDKVVFPTFVSSLTERQLELFVDRSMEGDGTRMKSNGQGIFSQRNLRRNRIFEMACALLGIATNTTAVPDKRPGKEGKVQYYTCMLKRGHITPRASSGYGQFTMKVVKHDGIVWCPTTPNSTWLARRRGTVFYTGNCQDTLGYPRAQMPQMRGWPEEGSHASTRPANKAGKVDIGADFIGHLWEKGIRVTKANIPASNLRASQAELVGARVAQLVTEARAGKDLRKRPIYVTSDDYICVDERTEILTRRGWLDWKTLRVGDVALTLNHDTGLSEWQPVQAINIYEPKRRSMLSMEGNSHSSLTTLDHKWPTVYVRHGTGDNGKRRWRTSGNLTVHDSLILAADCDTLPKTPVHSDELVELVAWAWTEGTIRPNGRNLHLAQSTIVNQRHCRSIRRALKELYGEPVNSLKSAISRIANSGQGRGFSYDDKPAWAESVDSRGIAAFRLTTSASRDVLRCLDDDKVVTAGFLASLTRSQLELFVKRSIDGDGSRYGTHPDVFAQKSEAGTKMFQMACALLGRRTCARWQDAAENAWGEGSFYTTVSQPHKPKTVRPLRRSRRTDSFQTQIVEHDGMVWCPTTSNHSWLARRDGTVYYTGNCDGHHHWAALVGLGAGKGKDLKVPVYVIHTDIGTAISEANAFAKHMGLKPKSGAAPVPVQQDVPERVPAVRNVNPEGFNQYKHGPGGLPIDAHKASEHAANRTRQAMRAEATYVGEQVEDKDPILVRKALEASTNGNHRDAAETHLFIVTKHNQAANWHDRERGGNQEIARLYRQAAEAHQHAAERHASEHLAAQSEQDWRPNEVLPEDFYANAFCPTGDKGGVNPHCPPHEASHQGSEQAVEKLNQTNTPAFKRWFRNSQVVDEHGKPLIVYHGTGADDFTHFATHDNPDPYANLDEMLGSHFAEDPTLTESFLKERVGWGEEQYKHHARVYPVFLSIQKPRVAPQRIIKATGELEHDATAINRDILDTAMPHLKDVFVRWAGKSRGVTPEQASEAFDRLNRGESIGKDEYNGVMHHDVTHEYHAHHANHVGAFLGNYDSGLLMLSREDKQKVVDTYKGELARMGYDGISYVNTAPMEKGKHSQKCWLAFTPGQIKSATGNRGSFDIKDPDVRNMESVADDSDLTGNTWTDAAREASARARRATADARAATNNLYREHEQGEDYLSDVIGDVTAYAEEAGLSASQALRHASRVNFDVRSARRMHQNPGTPRLMLHDIAQERGDDTEAGRINAAKANQHQLARINHESAIRSHGAAISDLEHAANHANTTLRVRIRGIIALHKAAQEEHEVASASHTAERTEHRALDPTYQASLAAHEATQAIDRGHMFSAQRPSSSVSALTSAGNGARRTAVEYHREALRFHDNWATTTARKVSKARRALHRAAAEAHSRAIEAHQAALEEAHEPPTENVNPEGYNQYKHGESGVNPGKMSASELRQHARSLGITEPASPKRLRELIKERMGQGGASFSQVQAPVNPAVPDEHVNAIMAAVKQHARHGIADLLAVRGSLGHLSREQQDAAIHEARRQRLVSGASYEGRHGVSEAQRAAAIPEEGASPIGMLQVLNTNPEGCNQYKPCGGTWHRIAPGVLRYKHPQGHYIVHSEEQEVGNAGRTRKVWMISSVGADQPWTQHEAPSDAATTLKDAKALVEGYNEPTANAAHIPTVAVDLDGTLAEYDGWQGEDHIGAPRPGAREAMQQLRNAGCRIVVFTCRGNVPVVKQWLDAHDIPYDYVNVNPDQVPGTSGKVQADVYIDDRAVDGRASWPSLVNDALKRLGVAANAFCPTGPGGGHDNSCGREVTVTHDDAYTYATSFTVGDKEFTFAARSDGTASNEWDVAFWPGTLAGGGPTTMTNDRNVSPVQVLRHVQQSLHQFVSSRSPSVMIFTASKREPSRITFYDRVTREVQNHYSYAPHSWDDKLSRYYVLTRGVEPEWLRDQMSKVPPTTTNATRLDDGSFASFLQKRCKEYLVGGQQKKQWSDYIQAGCLKGIGRAWDDVNAASAAQADAQDTISTNAKGETTASAAQHGRKQQWLNTQTASTATKKRIATMCDRAFNEMEGVSTETVRRMRRLLYDALLHGWKREQLAAALSKECDLGLNRAKMTATTELTRAHAEAQLMSYPSLGHGQVQVLAEWETGDNPCPKCQPLDGVVLPIDQARGLIPRHPGCKCAWSVVSASRPLKRQVRGAQAREAISDSVDAGSPDDWGGVSLVNTKGNPHHSGKVIGTDWERDLDKKIAAGDLVGAGRKHLMMAKQLDRAIAAHAKAHEIHRAAAEAYAVEHLAKSAEQDWAPPEMLPEYYHLNSAFDPAVSLEEAWNAFCPTRRGGGKLNTCPPARKGIGVSRPPAQPAKPVPVNLDRQKYVGKKISLDGRKKADSIEEEVARALGGETTPEYPHQKNLKPPHDVLVRKGNHALEVKNVLMKKGGAGAELSIHPDALLRKAEWYNGKPDPHWNMPSKGRQWHTVAIDDRDTYEGGAHASEYSGHRIYYRRGSGRYRLSQMHPVKSVAELKRLVNMKDKDLPPAARGSLPKNGTPEMEALRVKAGVAHEARNLKDRTRKQRIAAEKKAARVLAERTMRAGKRRKT